MRRTPAQAMCAADGLAKAQVQEAQANALRAEGMAQAEVKTATAKADEEAGMAEVRVLEQRLEADAEGEEKMGLARARAREEMAKAEAAGLVEKLKAYDNMSEDARHFEEFRMNLEVHEKETMARIEAQRIGMLENGKVMSAALKDAKFEMIGGDGGIFEKFAQGLGYGKSVEGVLDKSPSLQAALAGLSNRLAGDTSGKPAEKA